MIAWQEPEPGGQYSVPNASCKARTIRTRQSAAIVTRPERCSDSRAAMHDLCGLIVTDRIRLFEVPRVLLCSRTTRPDAGMFSDVACRVLQLLHGINVSYGPFWRLHLLFVFAWPSSLSSLRPASPTQGMRVRTPLVRPNFSSGRPRVSLRRYL